MAGICMKKVKSLCGCQNEKYIYADRVKKDNQTYTPAIYCGICNTRYWYTLEDFQWWVL